MLFLMNLRLHPQPVSSYCVANLCVVNTSCNMLVEIDAFSPLLFPWLLASVPLIVGCFYVVTNQIVSFTKSSDSLFIIIGLQEP